MAEEIINTSNVPESRFEGAQGGIVSVEAEPYSAIFWQTVSIYKFLYDAYNLEGGFKNIQGSYITGDSTELFYQTRNKLSHPRGWYSLFIDAQYEPLFNEQPPVYDVDDVVEGLIEDINRAGMSCDEYKMNLLASSINNGVAFMAYGSDGVEGTLPFYFYYTADQYNECLSETDIHGRVIKYVFTTELEEDKYRQDVYTDDYTEVRQSGERDNIGEVMTGDDGEPMHTEVKEQIIEALYSQRKEQLKVLPKPKNTGVAELFLGLYEQESEYRWTLKKQTNDILILRGDGVNGVINPTDSAINLDADQAGAGAEFISPGSDNPKNQLAGVEYTRSDLFEFMHQNGVMVMQVTSTDESGYAKTFTFRPVNTTLARSRKMSGKVDTYIGKTSSTVFKKTVKWECTYKKNFTPESGLTVIDLKDAAEVFSVNGSTEGVKATLKQVAIKIDSEDSDLIDAINDMPLSVTE